MERSVFPGVPAVLQNGDPEKGFLGLKPSRIDATLVLGNE